MFKPTYELESKSVGASQKSVIQLRGLPPGQRCTHVLLEMELAIANAHATVPKNAQVGDFASQIESIDLRSPLFEMRATGELLDALYHTMAGRTLNGGPGISVVSVPPLSSATGRVFFVVPFADFEAAEPMATAQPSELLEGRTLEVKFDSAALESDTDLTVTSGILYATAFFGRGSGDVLPAMTRIDYEDWSQQTALLREGSFSHLFIYDEVDESVVPDTDYTRVRVQMDGHDVIDNLRATQLVADWNIKKADSGADQLSEDATNPLLPILTAPKGYKLSALPSGLKVVRVDLTGATNGARFAYRLIGQREPQQEMHAIRRFGVSNPAAVRVEVKTLSGRALAGPAKRILKHRKMLPVRFQRT